VTRALSLFSAGLWLGLLVASWLLASITFRTAAAVLEPAGRPEVRERLASVPEERRLQVLRHLAAEINRAMFGRWLVVQLFLGAATFALVWRLGGPWWVTALALAIVVVQAGLQGPMLEIGRSVDFLPRPLPPELGSRFGRLHAAYVLLDFAKGGILAWLAWLLARAAR
jgi:hypothetical protein